MFANMSQERIEFNNLKSNIEYLQKQQVLWRQAQRLYLLHSN